MIDIVRRLFQSKHDRPAAQSADAIVAHLRSFSTDDSQRGEANVITTRLVQAGNEEALSTLIDLLASGRAAGTWKLAPYFELGLLMLGDRLGPPVASALKQKFRECTTDPAKEELCTSLVSVGIRVKDAEAVVMGVTASRENPLGSGSLMAVIDPNDPRLELPYSIEQFWSMGCDAMDPIAAWLAAPGEKDREVFQRVCGLTSFLPRTCWQDERVGRVTCLVSNIVRDMLRQGALVPSEALTMFDNVPPHPDGIAALSEWHRSGQGGASFQRIVKTTLEEHQRGLSRGST